MKGKRVLIDPAHDFGKNTFHSLEVTRRLGEMVDTGWPVLVSLSNKDFVGETLGLEVGERLTGTLAARREVCPECGEELEPGAVIPRGAPFVSDPVDVALPDLARLKVELYLPTATGPCTRSSTSPTARPARRSIARASRPRSSRGRP